MKKLKVYIGCAFTHAPQEYKDMIDAFKAWLKSHPWIEVLDFVEALRGKPQAEDEPALIYIHDIHRCAMRAQVMIGEVSYPSTGLGWELATTIEKKHIPTIMLARKSALVSKLPQGAANCSVDVHLHYYRSSLIELESVVIDLLYKEYLWINRSFLRKIFDFFLDFFK